MNTNLFRTMSPANMLNPVRTKGNWMIAVQPTDLQRSTPTRGNNQGKNSENNRFNLQNKYTKPFVIKKSAFNSYIHLQGNKIPLKKHTKKSEIF